VAHRRKPRSPHIQELLKNLQRGKTTSEEARRKIGEAHRRRDTIPPAMRGPPWTPEEDALLGRMRDREVEERIGRSAKAVFARRAELEIPRYPRG
jgi:hypothetical protein